MSDEPFLERWSRRKREVAKEEATDVRAAVPDTKPPCDPQSEVTADSNKDAGEQAPFDPASLPPIEEIVSTTDIRAFLAKGVPAALKRAALRRVWVADPSIRDFVGLAENDWDFTKPESIPGFGELAPDFDVQAMVRDVFGDRPEPAQDEVAVAQSPGEGMEAEPPETEIAAQSEGKDENDENDEPPADAPQREGEPHEAEAMVQRDTSAAPQKGITLSNHKNRRQHGGALPEEFPITKRGL